MNQQLTGKNVWDTTKELLGQYQVVFGSEGSRMVWDDPKKLGCLLSFYKFAAKMACKTGSVLELGCGEGLGVSILSENADYTGVDGCSHSIQRALANFSKRFLFDPDFLGKKYGVFNAVVSRRGSLDPQFFRTILHNLAPHGVVVLLGTEHTARAMKEFFYQVFTFGMSDEIVHTGSSNELICVGCHVRTK